MARLRPSRLFRRDGDEPAPPVPRTLVGRWLRATARRDADTRDRLIAELDRTGWVDAGLMLDASFRHAVTRHFRPDCDVRTITQTIVRAHEVGFDPVLMPLMETEAMIRKELGEDVDVADIDLELELEASLKPIAIVVICDVAGWKSPGELDEMLRSAEDAVVQAGGAPTLAGPTDA